MLLLEDAFCHVCGLPGGMLMQTTDHSRDTFAGALQAPKTMPCKHQRSCVIVTSQGVRRSQALAEFDQHQTPVDGIVAAYGYTGGL